LANIEGNDRKAPSKRLQNKSISHSKCDLERDESLNICALPAGI
jgi:hypothetical protein